MKITGLIVEGFAGVPGRLELDLDSSVVVLVGQNGFGKTTICDALAWGLTGLHPRGADPRSLYSTSGETQVTIIGNGTTGEWVVSRRIQNPSERNTDKLVVVTQLSSGGERHVDGEADRWLARHLVPLSDYADSRNTMSTLTRSFYMQQESLREYLTGRSDDERFTALSRMVGAGSLSEFLGAVESSLRAWKRAVTRIESEIEAPRARVEVMKSEQAQLEATVGSSQRADLESQWAEWWASIQEHLAPVDDLGQLSPEGLLQSRNLLSKQAGQIEAEIASLSAFEAELTLPLPSAPDDHELRGLSAVREEGRQQLQQSEERLAFARAAVVSAESALHRLSGERRELAALADLAQRHLGEGCPVCGQSIERESVSRQLDAVIQQRDEEISTPEYISVLGLYDEIAREVSEAKRKLEATENLYSSAQEKMALREKLHERRLRKFAAFGLSRNFDIAEQDAVIAARRRDLEANQKVLVGLLEEASRIEAVSQLEGLRSRLAVIADDLTIASEELGAQERDLRSRQETVTEAEAIISLLRADAERFVNSRLDDIQPVLDQLYAAVDPHPTFRSVRLVTRIHYGKHRLNPVVEDSEAEVSVSDPGRTLSTSQANALAVTLFLAFNLGITATMMRSIVLDDPLQNLDDVHLLGLVDLLRKLQPHRQMIVTTHDSDFAALLMRKLRPHGTDERARLIRITRWDRKGPLVEVSDIMADRDPVKIALVG